MKNSKMSIHSNLDIPHLHLFITLLFKNSDNPREDKRSDNTREKTRIESRHKTRQDVGHDIRDKRREDKRQDKKSRDLAFFVLVVLC